MSYILKPESWSSMFPVPTEIVDKHIKLAGAAQLKALLWMLRHAADGFDEEKMAQDIGQSRADAMDALQYWIEKGIIIKSPVQNIAEAPANKPNDIPQKAAEQKEEAHEKKIILPNLPEEKPTYQQIIIRCKETPELQMLFSEVQKKLGRTIGYDGQSTFLMIYDRYGLPVEVILMMVEYCVSIGKASIGYIAKVGKNWGEREIDTLEKADEEIMRLKSCLGVWKEFIKLTGIQNPRPTSAQSEYLLCWTQKMKFSVDMLYIAYEQMAENTSRLSFPYMNKILDNWYKNGIKTPDDIKKFNAKHKAEMSKANQSNEKNKSYNMDEFTSRGDRLPVYNKKGGA